MAFTENKPVALVTGGTVRVGRAIVEHLIARGFAVAFTYLGSQQQAEQLSQQYKTDAQAIRVDLTKPDVAATAIHEALTSDHVDLIVNNASIYEPTTDAEQLHRMMAIHCETPLAIVRALEPRLRAAKGCIVNMVDLLVERPWPQLSNYCASKAALWNQTLSLARSLAPDVRVNGIAPGVVEWPKDYPETEKQKYLGRVPLGRAGTPQDVAKLVHFLATEGTYITGQIIRLDGGRSIT